MTKAQLACASRRRMCVIKSGIATQGSVDTLGTWIAASLALFSKPLSCRSHNRKLPATLAPHVSAGSHTDKTVNHEPKSQLSIQRTTSLARFRVSLWLPKGVGTFGRCQGQRARDSSNQARKASASMDVATCTLGACPRSPSRSKYVPPALQHAAASTSRKQSTTWYISGAMT